MKKSQFDLYHFIYYIYIINSALLLREKAGQAERPGTEGPALLRTEKKVRRPVLTLFISRLKKRIRPKRLKKDRHSIRSVRW